MPYVIINLSDYEYNRICEMPGCVDPTVNYAVRSGTLLPEGVNPSIARILSKEYLEKKQKEDK